VLGIAAFLIVGVITENRSGIVVDVNHVDTFR